MAAEMVTLLTASQCARLDLLTRNQSHQAKQGDQYER